MHCHNASNSQFESQSALTFPKIVFRLVFHYNNSAMSSGERDSLNLGFPHLICFASVCCNISAMAGQYLMKSLVDSKYMYDV